MLGEDNALKTACGGVLLSQNACVGSRVRLSDGSESRMADWHAYPQGGKYKMVELITNDASVKVSAKHGVFKVCDNGTAASFARVLKVPTRRWQHTKHLTL